MNTFFIYGLIDPTTNELRYIGKSINPIVRLRKHISEKDKGDTYKNRWLRKLINNKIKPELIILDELSNDWQYWESFYILYFKSLGCKLTNATSGGDAPPLTKGYKHSDESKRKMSVNKKGKPIPWLNNKDKTIEHRENISKSMRGKVSPNKGKKYTEEHKIKLSNASTVNKPVLQFNLDGIFIKEWSSKSLAERTLKIRHISECCRNEYKTAGGYKWQYKS